jgi:hypothetical protein
MRTRPLQIARQLPSPGNRGIQVLPIRTGAHAAYRDVGFLSVIALNNRAPGTFFDFQCDLLAREANQGYLPDPLFIRLYDHAIVGGRVIQGHNPGRCGDHYFGSLHDPELDAGSRTVPTDGVFPRSHPLPGHDFGRAHMQRPFVGGEDVGCQQEC